MTSKIVVNNIESDSGISSVTFTSDIELGTKNLKGHNLESTGIVTAISFTGSGANLTNLPAGNLTGTIADARFPSTLPAVDGSALTGIDTSFGSGTSVNTTGIITATAFIPTTGQLSHRNIIINGDIRIAQRDTSHNSSGYRTVDRFLMTAGGASHTLTQAQVDVASGTTPYTEGFRKAYSITNAGQNANNQAYAYMRYKVEAQDVANSGWNYTSSSSFITISFWIKASVTQTYLFFLHTNDGGTKEYNHLMSLSANTWTKITLNVPGNSGLQFDNDNGLGLNIYWTAYLGDHYTSTGSVDQWVTHAGYTSRPDMGSTWWTTSNATFQLTGVQLEVGSVATPFEHRSFGDELRRCERYYQVLAEPKQDSGVSNISTHGGNFYGVIHYHTVMRASPTLVVSNFTNAFRAYGNQGTNPSTLTLNNGGSHSMVIQGSGDPGTAGWLRCYLGNPVGGAFATVAAQSEL